MGRLIRAAFYKISKDWTFKITLIVGVGLSLLMALIYMSIDLVSASAGFKMCTGATLFITSWSPAQNFGIAIPINVAIYTILEFTQGTLRNKVIIGHTRFKLYCSLFFSGLLFTLSLIIVYSLFSLAFGSLFGMSFQGIFGANLSWDFALKFVVPSLLSYFFIASLAVFIASNVRNIGPSIPIIIIPIILFGIAPSVISVLNNPTLTKAIMWIDPFYLSSSVVTMLSSTAVTGTLPDINEPALAGSIMSVVYTILFFGLGVWTFTKRDLK